MTPDQASALTDAKRSADELTAVYSVYKTVANLIGATPRTNNTEASRLGDFETFGQLDNAAHLMRVLAERGNDDPPIMLPLAPHICVLVSGGTLNLKRPKDADTQCLKLGGDL